MSAPTETSAAALKRLGRYLLGHQRLVYTYPWQRAEGIDVYSDTDWSGLVDQRWMHHDRASLHQNAELDPAVGHSVLW
jgi:hypothetical protein